MNKKTPKKKITQEMLYRSVASSTAIETGESVQDVERKLKANKEKFRHIQLAS